MPLDPATRLRDLPDLIITCRVCGRVTRVPASVLHGGALLVPNVGELARRLKCSACGAKGQVELETEAQGSP